MVICPTYTVRRGSFGVSKSCGAGLAKVVIEGANLKLTCGGRMEGWPVEVTPRFISN